MTEEMTVERALGTIWSNILWELTPPVDDTQQRKYEFIKVVLVTLAQAEYKRGRRDGLAEAQDSKEPGGCHLIDPADVDQYRYEHRPGR